MAYLDSHGLQTLWTRIKATFGSKIANDRTATAVNIKLQNASGTQLESTSIPAATDALAGVMTATDKSKLDGIEAQANNYVHPTSSGNKHIPAGGASGKILGWSADGTAVWVDAADTGVVKITAGDNVQINPEGGTGEVEISATDTVYTHPTFTAHEAGLYKVTINGEGHVTAATLVAKSDITALGIPAQDTTYVFNTAYNASTNKAATMSDIQTAMTGAAKYKGTIASETALTALANYKVGEYWVASASFTSTSKGITIDAGNMIFANTDAATYVATNFDVIQSDIEAVPDSVINALS